MYADDRKLETARSLTAVPHPADLAWGYLDRCPQG